MEKLEVIQIRKRKPTKEPVRQPDTYDKIVERAFWFVIGFSIALLSAVLLSGRHCMHKKSAIARRQPLRHLEK